MNSFMSIVPMLLRDPRAASKFTDYEKILNMNRKFVKITISFTIHIKVSFPTPFDVFSTLYNYIAL
jgi:hypothetical protein